MSIGQYTSQNRKLREMATEKLGHEAVSGMCDGDIDDFIEKEYVVFWGDDADDFGFHRSDNEVIALIPRETYERLLGSGDIIFVQR